jgi:acetyl esterase/lipase
MTVQGTERLDPMLVATAPLITLGLSAATLPAIRDSLNTRRAATIAAIPAGSVAVQTRRLDLDDRGVGLRVYRGTPEPAAPALLYCHSGAYLLGNLDTDHARCLALARDAACVVVSVDYRLAPEFAYPAALDDCYAALAALSRDGDGWGVDPGAIAIGGSSAGAGLAAAVALRARDAGGPALCFQLLHQPMLDRRCDTPSMREFTATPAFDADSARYAWAAYLGDAHRGPADGDPHASPALAASLSGLPPAFVGCSEVDPLRDEAIEYARRLLVDGVPTELHVYPSTCHGFDSIAPDHPASVRAQAEQGAALAAAFARVPASQPV